MDVCSAYHAVIKNKIDNSVTISIQLFALIR